MLGEDQPDAIPNRKINYMRPDRVDYASTVLTWCHFIER
jgi:hypothetical protein